MYRVFARNWWKENPVYPFGLEPNSEAPKQKLAIVDTISQARKLCEEFNQVNDPGRLGRMAEFEKMD